MSARPRLALASRGDALTPYLFDAIERAYPVVGRLDVELTPAQRYLVGATSFRVPRDRWVERFFKSGLANRLRSGNARHALRRLSAAPEGIVQVHALFRLAGAPSALYIDTTHLQAARGWPDWNPLRGRALADWLEQEQRVYDGASHLFAFTRAAAESLHDDYGQPDDKVTVVGAGVNLDDLPRPLDRRETREDPVVLFVGNDWRRKGGPVLMEAFEEVRRAIPRARLVLAGTRAPVEPQPGVTVLGRVHDRARVAALFRDADVFAFPSLFDPYGIAVLEAMAFGLPVVTTPSSGVHEMVEPGRTASLVPPGDAPALAGALLHLLQHPGEARAMGAAARRSIEEGFTWDAVVRRMAPALDRLADAPGGSVALSGSASS